MTWLWIVGAFAAGGIVAVVILAMWFASNFRPFR